MAFLRLSDLLGAGAIGGSDIIGSAALDCGGSLLVVVVE